MAMKEALGPLVLVAPSRPLVGRVLACVEDMFPLYVKIRVPRNGRWWIDVDEPDEDTPSDDLADDVWVADDRSDYIPRPRIGDWVEYRQHRVKRLPPLRVEAEFERVGDEYDGPRRDMELDPRTHHLRVPAIPWLDEWLRRAQQGLVMVSDAFRWEPRLFGTRYCQFICTCSEDLCGSLHGRIDWDPVAELVVWSEIHAMPGELQLGPALGFDVEWYRTAAERFGLRRSGRFHMMGSL